VNSNPWDWWDPADPMGANETNPNIKSQSITYIDSVMGFIVPRIAYTFKQNGLNVPGLGEAENGDLPGELKIFPNPARNFVTISYSLEDISEIVLRDLTGREVSRIAVNAPEARIAVDNIPSGIYLLSIETRSGLSTYRKLQVH
jgi:hypothetical protein